MADFDAALDETEVRIPTMMYCADCMAPMKTLSEDAAVCNKCGFQYSEK